MIPQYNSPTIIEMHSELRSFVIDFILVGMYNVNVM